MRRKHKRYQIYGSSWFRRIAATLLVGSIIQNPISTFAQRVPRPTISNQAAFSYKNTNANQSFNGVTRQITVTPNNPASVTYVDPFGPNSVLVDPFGQILDCNGDELEDYTGFTVTLFNVDPNDPTGTEPGTEVDLTTTEVPDIPNNGIPLGIQPNITNTNNYRLTNNRVASIDGVERRGVYNFLFDQARGQTQVGQTYILAVTPPENSNLPERRIRLEITNLDGNILTYVATAVDGQPITVLEGNESAQQLSDNQISDRALIIEDAERVGLSLALRFNLNLCSTEQIRITKTGDRATAEPGDTTVYRLSLRNIGDDNLNDVVVTDQFPIGFKFLPESVRGELAGEPVEINTQTNGREVTFTTDAAIPVGSVLNIAYGAKLTPDAVRGSGRNTATVNAERVDNNFAVKDGPATHLLKIRPGITSNCGTIIGRVFVDKNFDGEQQPGEPGVPNAVIFLEDGNRITTDPDGLYSVKNVLPGKHTGVLDLQSLPGYTLAPNIKFKERNSQSRLVNLEPGGMVRMNFAVTPSFGEEAKK